MSAQTIYQLSWTFKAANWTDIVGIFYMGFDYFKNRNTLINEY